MNPFPQGGKRRLRVLVVSAAPVGDGVPLDLRREWLLLQKQVKEGGVPVALSRLLPPTREALQQALHGCAERDVSPQVLHFAGHGQPGYLSFEDTLCQHVPYRREELAGDLRGKGVRLLVLNACHTATRETVSLARYLQEAGVVEAAIGHERPVEDGAAVLFAGQVYRGLCQGKSVLQAFAAAEGVLAKSYPGAARSTQLFGGDHLRLGGIAESEGAAPMIFDGTSGRGRMVEVPHFFGRAREVVEIGRFLEDPGMRVLAVAGVGGIGKTTLVEEIGNRHAWRFPGGMAFASVRSSHFGKPSAEDLIKSVASKLMLAEASGPALLDRLFGHMQEHPALLVFDNLEDLSGEELEVLVRVLGEMPLNGSKALLTLRPAPQLLQEWPWLQAVVLTQGLSPRAGAAYVVHAARGRVPAISEARLGEDGAFQGLPLGLTLALAGHPKMLDIAVGIAAQHGLADLKGAVPELEEAAAARELAAEAIETRMDKLLESSLRLLDDDGRWLLGMLPLFPGGDFAREELLAAALGVLDVAEEDEEQKAGAAKRIKAGLASCAAAGLIDRDAGTELYRFHPTVQGYVGMHAKLEGEAMNRGFWGLFRAAQRYVDEQRGDYDALDLRLFHLLGLFETAWNIEGAPEKIRGAVAQAINAMGDFFYHRGHWTIMTRWREHLASGPEDEGRARAHRLYRESILLAGQGKYEEARALLRESLQILDDIGDRQGRAASLHQLSTIEYLQGHYTEGRALLRESIQILDEIGDRQGRAASLHLLALFEESQAHYDEARILLRESIQIKNESDDRQGRAASLHQLASIEHKQGQYGEARTLLRESIQILNEIGDRKGLSTSLHSFANIEASQGYYAEARALLRESLQIKDEIGDRQGRAASLHLLASIEASQGHYAEARALLRESLHIAGEIGDRKGWAASLHQLAIIEENQGRYGEVGALLSESIQILNEIGDRKGRAASLHQFAIIEARLGHFAEARDLLRKSIQIDDEIGNRKGRALSLHQFAIIEGREGHHAEASALLHESIQIVDELGDQQGKATSLILLGQLEATQDHLEEGKALVREGIAILEELGSGEIDQAQQILRNMEAGRTAPNAPPAEQEDDPAPNNPAALLNAAVQLLRTGHPEETLTAIREALPALASYPQALGPAHSIEAQALMALGRPEEALTVLEQATTEAAAAGLRDQVEALRKLNEQIRQAAALTKLATATIEDLEQRAHGPAELASLLLQKAAAHLTADEPQEARQLLTRAKKEAEASGNPLARLEVLVNSAAMLGAMAEPALARAALEEARPLAREHARQALAAIEEIEQSLAGDGG